MIKVSVFYPAGENKKFDMDYYCKRHMPLVQQTVGAACKSMAVEQGLAGGAPGAPPTYAAMGHLYFESLAVSRRPSCRTPRRCSPTSRTTPTSSR
jgi:uncharacterized protein (TIGR02118 family)